MATGETSGAPGDAWASQWDTFQAQLSDFHWALQDFLRSLVVGSAHHEGRVSPCPRCKGDGKGPPGDGGLAQRKQRHLQEARSSRGESAPPQQQRHAAGSLGHSSRPFAVLRRWWGLGLPGEKGGRRQQARQCWFCDGVGIMPIVNLHGYLCAWAPAAFATREHPVCSPRLPPRRALRSGRCALVRLRVMRVVKARKVTGERLQHFVGSVVPEFEARERAGHKMPHWHEARSRRRGNLLEFDWRRAQWIADVQDIVETAEGAPPSAEVNAGGAGPSGARVWRGLAKAAHLTGGDGQAAGSGAVERWVRAWQQQSAGPAPGASASPALPLREAGQPPVHSRAGPHTWHARRRGDEGGGRRAPERSGGRGVGGAQLDAEFPEDLVSIRPGYEDAGEGGQAGPRRALTFRDRIFHPASPLQPMLRISEALTWSFRKRARSHHQQAGAGLQNR